MKKAWTWINMVRKEIWNLIKIIWKWIGIFIKKVWLGMIGIALWFSVCFIIYKQTDLLISDKIQAWAIVTLVFVTLFYARQTWRLVKEEKKRREAEFGERRVKELFYPLGMELIKLREFLLGHILSSEKIKEMFEKFEELHFEKGYMATKIINDEILKFRKEFHEILDMVETTQRKNAVDLLEKMILYLNAESRKIVIKIKKTYGYYSGETVKKIKKVNHEKAKERKKS